MLPNFLDFLDAVILTGQNRGHHSGEHHEHDGEKQTAGVAHHFGGVVADSVKNRPYEDSYYKMCH